MNIDGIVFWGEDFEIGMNWGLIFRDNEGGYRIRLLRWF